MSDFAVRNASADELEAAVRLVISIVPEWHVGPHDLSCAFALDPTRRTAVYLGHLNNDVISAVSAVKYPGHSVHIASFVVKEEHRGKGYGKLTWEAAWKCIDDQCSIGLDAAPAMIPKYQGLGFQSVWDTVVVSLSAKKIVDRFCDVKNLSVVTKPVGAIELGDLIAYDASVIGTGRGKFLEKWVNIPGSLSWVAVNKDGGIIGYISVRQVFSGARMELRLLGIGPLYADDDVIAKLLLKEAAKAYVMGNDSDRKFELLCCNGGECGNHGLQLVSGIEADPPVVIGPRMYKNGIPSGRQLDKIYGTTSPAFD